MPVEFERGSFRDASARVFYHDGEVFRALSAHAADEWTRIERTRFWQRALAEGRVVGTTRAPAPAGLDGAWALVLRHERIPFVSYPYEWSFEMLREATRLQLDLLAAALEEDLVLKDGTAYNVQWRGVQPVFVDVLSFAPLAPGEPWVGYRQFCELGLYPLLLEAYRGVAFQPWLRGRIDGIPAEEMRRLLGGRALLKPGVFSHVHLHALSQRRFESASRSLRTEIAAGGFGKALIQTNVRKLQRLVGRLARPATRSAWAGYARAPGYEDHDQAAKQQFVRAALGRGRWGHVWDLGANQGVYARLAAEVAEYVVAFDADRVVVDAMFIEHRRRGVTNVLPLVVNLADPSPSQGWNSEERLRLERRGQPDLVLALALVHHLAIGANIPLRALLDWLATLAPHLIIEFVTRDDPMVERLLRFKDPRQHADYDLPTFERELTARFDLLAHQPLAGGRRLLFFARSRCHT
ncbi:MAG: methyltransferase [Luteitalea sp.]|nr:methyltransferase [Luteitalea sp.]